MHRLTEFIFDRTFSPVVALVVGLAALVALVASPAGVSEAEASSPERNRPDSGADSDSTSPFRGSTVSLEQSLAHRTLQPAGQLTYDPYYNLELALEPRWWPHDNWYLSGSFSLSQELTHSNVTTKKNELWPSDTSLRGGTPKLFTVPEAEIDVSVGAELQFPTSKPSRARSLVVATGALVGLRRRFSVMKGLNLRYDGRVQKRFHRYQTLSLESPRIDNCADLARGCDPYAHSGRRNPTVRHVHTGSVSFRPLRSLSFSATGGVYVDHLYAAADVDASTGSPVEGSNVRHTAIWLVGTTYQFTDWMSLTGGLRSIHPQLAPDSSYYTPAFNRYAEWRLDASLDVPALVDAF